MAINPYQRLPIYGKAWVKYYRGKRIGLLPPHVYAVAEAAYTSMIDHNVNQSVLVRYALTGRRLRPLGVVHAFLCRVQW